MKLSDILKTSCKSFSMKFLEVNNSWNYLQYFAKDIEQNFMKEFLVNKRRSSVQSLTQRLTQFTWNTGNTLLYSLCKKQSRDLSLLLLRGLDCLILLSLWICWFCIIRVFFKYLLRFHVHFLQIFLLGLQEVTTFDFSSRFWLVPFHEGSKMISKTSCRTAISSQLFKLSAIFPTSRFTFIYTLVRHSYHHKNVIFFIHNMIDLRKGGSRLVI